MSKRKGDKSPTQQQFHLDQTTMITIYKQSFKLNSGFDFSIKNKKCLIEKSSVIDSEKEKKKHHQQQQKQFFKVIIINK